MARYEELIIGRAYVEELIGTDQGGYEGNKSLKPYVGKETLADDAEFALPEGGEGFAIVTDETNAVVAHLKSDGTVLGIVTSGSAATTDSDTNLCVYASGGVDYVKNRTGAEVEVSVIYFQIAR